MDKKRRVKTLWKTDLENLTTAHTLLRFSQLISTEEQCGICSKKFIFFKEYGSGYFEFHQLDGLYISVLDVSLKKDITTQGSLNKNFLELAFLIEGEQIIKIKGIANDFVYESQESYLVYLSNITGSVTYHKNKHLKEIKIRMNISFIKRYRLNEEYDILNKYSLKNLKNSIIQPLCTKTQEILSEILIDKRKGLLKRLFLESKILELITLKLDIKSTSQSKMTNQTNNLIKKLYKVQHLISSDLTIQLSIQQLAREIGVNDFTLKKEFKSMFDKTIFEYASELRMNKAKQLLQHTKKPIYEISELVGYKNATHFTAAFKKTEGITPKKYRNTSEIKRD